MAIDQIQSKAFPDDDHIWRVIWIGRVFSPTGNLATLARRTPMVEVQIAQLDRHRQPTGVSQLAFLSVMEFPRLRVGTEWRKGSPLPTRIGRLSQRTFHVEFGPTAQLVEAHHRLGRRYLIPPFNYPVPTALRRTMLYWARNARTIGAPSADPWELLIPCTEVFRGWYGINARFAYHLISGAWTDIPNHRIFDKTVSWEHKRIVFVKLGDRMKDIDADQVARLAFDPIGEQQTTHLIANTIAATNRGSRYALTVKPPFYGCTDLQVSGIEIVTLERVTDPDTLHKVIVPWRRFLALQVLRCTGPQPYDPGDLFSSRDNDGTSALNDSADKRTAYDGVVKKKHADTEVPMQIFEDLDPDAGDAPLEIPDYDIAPVFAITPARKIENEDAESKTGARTIESKDPISCGSSGIGTGQSPRNNVALEPMYEDEGQENDVGSLAYFRRAIEALPDEATARGSTAIVDISVRPMKWARAFGEPSLWATMPFDGQRRARRTMFASIALDGDVFHVFEIERRPSEEFSTQFVWSEDGRALPGSMIQCLFSVCAQNQGTLVPDARWIAHGLHVVQRAHLRHHHKNTAETFGRRILSRLLTLLKPAPPGRPPNQLESDQESA